MSMLVVMARATAVAAPGCAIVLLPSSMTEPRRRAMCLDRPNAWIAIDSRGVSFDMPDNGRWCRSVDAGRCYWV
jgi:hypothetical protein